MLAVTSSGAKDSFLLGITLGLKTDITLVDTTVSPVSTLFKTYTLSSQKSDGSGEKL